MTLLTTPHRGLSPLRVALANGAVVTAQRSPVTPAVTVHASFAAGSIADPPDRPGVAHFVARTIDRGSAARSGDQIADQLEDRGMALHVTVNRHALQLVLTCLVGDLDAALDLLADIVRHPQFPAADVQQKRNEIVTLIRQDEDNPAAVTTEQTMAALYGADHPYGWRPRGSVASVEAIGRDTLAAFHATHVVPGALSLVMVGDVEPAAAVAAAARVFDDWRAPAPPPILLPEPSPPAARRIQFFPMPGKAQADLSYGLLAVRRADPRFYACWLMNNILGQYSLGGRLGDRIRERQGMAYYVFSAMDANVIRGPLTVRAGVSADNVERALASIDGELRAFAADGPTDRELAESKQYLVGSMPRTLETNLGIATFLQMVEHFALGPDYDTRVPALLGAVTRDEVHAVARELLDPDRAVIAVAGPPPGVSA